VPKSDRFSRQGRALPRRDREGRVPDWGIALCALVTLVAVTIQALEVSVLGHPNVEAIVIAILLGTAL
jgi:hypothetical protein